ncbi:hypothetical protein Taro_002870 [Colocasia esculenta]|uniref:Uncharacterized protein n=1 Tax=Colocasia esculenta TaxID=4460 RepID=A0A843TMQ4_COLES|nr:hypothetical protein [Colocasia esculenta]
MTLNGNEVVIDACAKGNLGRFINHSCEPNCRTEKWMVNGEVCIGLFAIRDIKMGEEVTFDYNYVRVFGAAAKRCVCGSAECRGYIGGDPLNTENIVQGDSDEEYPEPVMVIEDGVSEVKVDEIIPESIDATDPLHEISVQSAGKASKTPVVSLTVETALQNDGTSLISSDGQLLETLPLASKSKEVTDPFLDDNKCMPSTNVISPYTSGSPLHAKSSHSSCSVKKRSCSSKKSVMQRGKKSSAIPLTQPTVCRAGHFDAVEEKLNELLDAYGGISKRRDATKGYLKLLFLTASSGDNVLEFLAVREILTPEHINNIPSPVGVESFKESMIKLTYHNDVQVHQMARNFRDKWLPRTIRKVHLSDRENGWLTSKRANSNWFLPLSSNPSQIQCVWNTDAICISQPDCDPSSPHGTDARPEARSFCSQLASTSVPSGDVSSTAVAKPRKRKSRWDQPSDAPSLSSQVQSIEGHTAKASPKVMGYAVGQTELEPHRASKSGKEVLNSFDGTISHDDMILQGIEEVPPGFGPPATNAQPWTQPDTSMIYAEAVAGHPQERYLPRLTVSYGIPLALVEQLGTDAERSENWRHHSWAIAPGMPFHPFPPLPPYPRGETSPAPGHSTKIAESREETRPTDSASGHLDPSTSSESAERSSMALENGAADQQPPEKMNSGEILEARVSPKLPLPTIALYDGTTDPADHIHGFESHMVFHRASDAAKYRAFPATLKETARAWFETLPAGSISSFRQLKKSFRDNFLGGRSQPRTAASLLTIRQKKSEALWDFVKRF